jgi:hypothetical protein
MKLFYMRRIVLLVFAGCLLISVPAAASDTTNAVKQFMEKAQLAYRSAAYLSFNVLYRYANNNQPNNYIDTMSGEVAIDKNRSRFVIDNIETVNNDKYSIKVMEEEKLIYLSAASSASVVMDPVHIMDTVLAHLKGVQMKIERGKGDNTLHIVFPPGQQYKSISMTINESTGYFQKVVYELYTEGLVAQDQMVQPGNTGQYQAEGRVEVLFSNYRRGQFDDSLFDESLYFIRLGKGNYQPSEKYKDYQIFLASTTL